jgi:hypothetical protein
MAAQLGPGWGQPKISKIESGKQMPTEDDILDWARATGTDADELLALLDNAAHEYRTFRDAYPAAGGPAAHQASYADAEQAAITIFHYAPLIVPAPLQTPDYARAALALPGGPADHGATPDDIDRMIAARMRRASILYEPGRDITILVGEGALRTQVGSAEIMRRQRDHIAHLAATVAHAKIGVIPFERCPILPIHGWRQVDELVSIETTAGDLEIADPTEVQQYQRWGDLLVQAALLGQGVARRLLDG